MRALLVKQYFAGILLFAIASTATFGQTVERPSTSVSGSHWRTERSVTNVAPQSGDPFVGDKISPDLRELLVAGHPETSVSTIIQTEDAESTAYQKFLEQGPGEIRGVAKSLGMLEVVLPLRSLQAVADDARTQHISLNLETRSLGHVETTTGAAAMRAVAGNSGLDGTGIGIAILDSGIYDGHDAFTGAAGESRVTQEVQFAPGGPEDLYGHGTHVAALAAGRGGRPGDTASINILRNYQGVAPGANIISVRVLTNTGTGSSANLIQALNWILENRGGHNIRVVNISLGTAAVETWQNDPLCRAVRKLTGAGVVVVAAAGNDGT
ncbi:MAG TPA: S8 family serine peptidase, partial [Pyrinomonadaceae bacterium]|nr:S8 family serine peptidase [Pyrinomonadaceae bacterium]